MKIMKQSKKIFTTIYFFFFLCANAQYLKSSEPINAFLATQKIERGKKYILQADKVSNKQALRIFNGGEGPDHVGEPNVPIDYKDGLFVEKYWKKMYEKYASDTIKRYWKKEDFPEYDFILESKEGLFGSAFHDKYMNSKIEDVVMISEPMYYMERKYVMFYFNIASFFGSNQPEVVIMKKEKEKWIVVKVIGDYVYY